MYVKHVCMHACFTSITGAFFQVLSIFTKKSVSANWYSKLVLPDRPGLCSYLDYHKVSYWSSTYKFNAAVLNNVPSSLGLAAHRYASGI